MRHRRRSFAGQEWAIHDVRWVAAVLTPLALVKLYPAFIWVFLATLLALVVRIAVPVVRRKQRERANADAPFWADRIRD